MTMSLESLPRPFLGRLLIEAVDTDVREHLEKLAKLDEAPSLKNAGFQIVNAEADIDPETGVSKGYKMKSQLRTPIKRGRIIKMAEDSFGQWFMEKRGDDIGIVPKLGDVVWFIPNETYQIDVHGKYHLVNDIDIVAIDEPRKDLKEESKVC